MLRAPHYLFLARLFGPLVPSFAEGVEGAPKFTEICEPEDEEADVN